MNKVKAQADIELRRNGEGYWDPTAYHAIKKADADLEKKRNPGGKKKTRPRGFYVGPHDRDRKMTLKQYIKQKLKILSELGLELTEEEENYLRSLKNEIDIDAYAHRLIIGKD